MTPDSALQARLNVPGARLTVRIRGGMTGATLISSRARKLGWSCPPNCNNVCEVVAVTMNTTLVQGNFGRLERLKTVTLSQLAVNWLGVRPSGLASQNENR